MEEEKAIAIVYKGECYPDPFRVDLLVDRKLLVEVKCIAQLGPKEFKQLRTYLALTNSKLGVLVNFGGMKLSGNFRRVANGFDDDASLRH